VRGGSLSEYTVTPEEVGLTRHSADLVPGGDPAFNAEVTREILAGEPGAARDLAVLNAGAAIYAGGVSDSLPAGVAAAQEAIDSGTAALKLGEFVERTHALAGPASATTAS